MTFIMFTTCNSAFLELIFMTVVRVHFPSVYPFIDYLDLKKTACFWQIVLWYHEKENKERSYFFRLNVQAFLKVNYRPQTLSIWLDAFVLDLFRILMQRTEHPKGKWNSHSTLCCEMTCKTRALGIRRHWHFSFENCCITQNWDSSGKPDRNI